MSPVGEMARVAEAIRDPTRRAILLDLFGREEGRTVDEAAAGARVHRTVAHGHLERLAALGYLTAESRRGRRGKPAKVYRLRAGPISFTAPARRYPELAAVLAEALGGLGPAAGELARRGGRRWGSRLAAPAAPGAGPLGGLGELGAEWRLEEGLITAANCLFAEACAAAPAVVCGVQAGILEGALRAAGIHRAVEPLGPRPGGGCAYRLADGDGDGTGRRR